MSLAETISGISRRKSLEKKAERDFYCVIDEIVGFLDIVEDLAVMDYVDALKAGNYDRAIEISRSERFPQELLPEFALFPSRSDVRKGLDDWRREYGTYAVAYA